MSEPARQFDPKNPQAYYAAVRARLTRNVPIPPYKTTNTKIINIPRQPLMSDEEAEAYENLYLVILARSIEAQERLMQSRGEPSLQRLLYETAAKYGMTIPELISARREASLVEARQEYMWRAKKETSKSLGQIGKVCGGRDHTTVLHGLRKYKDRLGL